MVRYLLNQGADPTAGDRWRNSPLDDAERNRDVAVADILKQAIADYHTEAAAVGRSLYPVRTVMLQAPV
jgi:ankyrin repeat protein